MIFSPAEDILLPDALTNHPLTHTREPGYVRGRKGLIEAHYDSHILPDDNSQGKRTGEHLYCVRFEATELWGKDSTSQHFVYVDLWESYLDRA